MTVESEIVEIVRAHNLRHLSATVTEDGRVKVSVLERKPPRVKGFDPVKYYQGHRDAIRKYQHEYYLRIRRSKLSGPENVTFKSKENNNKMTHISVDFAEAVQERIPNRKDDFSFFDSSEMVSATEAVQRPISERNDDESFFHFSDTTSSIVTHDQLASAMAHCYSEVGRKTKQNEFGETATQIMQFFGFEREVVGNHLEQDEIALMYQLEDIGLVSTRIEEYTLMDGTPWRVNYFILNSEKIREFSSKTVRTNQDNASLVYENLPAEVWAK
jgi:hypothetical protein